MILLENLLAFIFLSLIELCSFYRLIKFIYTPEYNNALLLTGVWIAIYYESSVPNMFCLSKSDEKGVDCVRKT